MSASFLPRPLLACLLGVALVPGLAWAGFTIRGENLAVTYNDSGTWNDNTIGLGLQYRSTTGTWVDFTYPGLPYQLLSVDYSEAGRADSAYTVSGYTPSATFTTLSNEDRSDETRMRFAWSGVDGSLLVDRYEIWDLGGSVLVVTVRITNEGTSTLSNLKLLFALDPDPDASYSYYTTYNNARNLDGSWGDDWVVSIGPRSGLSIGLGACEGSRTDVGHYSSWESSTSASVTLSDMRSELSDLAMGLRYNAASNLGPGESLLTSFLVVLSTSSSTIEATYTASLELCSICDADADGYVADTCGGDDCDDDVSSVHPGAIEIFYDGRDQDCDGLSDYDQDGDGHDDELHGGDDCNDIDPLVLPSAEEIWYDGVDQDCDGLSDYDQDGDGYDDALHGGDDCDDLDASRSPLAEEIWYDGVDQDCDGLSDYDRDGDGHDARNKGDDCDDEDPTVWKDCSDRPDKDDTSDTGLLWGEVPGKGGCGCASGPGSLWPSSALLALGLLLRRRRREP